MSETGILTAQYVRISQPAASPGDRLVAQLVDWAAQLAYIVFMIWLATKWRAASNHEFHYIFFGILLPVMCYPLLAEVLCQGQTLGKALCRMRVVMLDGSTPTLGAYLLRWLLIIVDGPLLAYTGLLVIVLTRNHQRIGDLAAGTVVIKLQSYARSRVSLDCYDYLAADYRPQYAAAAELSAQQADVINRTLKDGGSMRLRQLSERVEQLMGTPRHEDHDEQFLQCVLRDYHYYAMETI